MLKEAIGNTFSALKIRNYRLYFIGQAISLCGSWMQSIAQGWLVIQLTGSGTALGLVMALQFSPIFFLSPWGGIIADRYSKLRLLYLTQSVYGILAAIFGALIATDSIRLWMVYVFALFWGLVNIVDNPSRHSLMAETVSADRLANAVALNSAEVSLARAVGPAIGGVLIIKIGLAACFISNAISFMAVIVVLLMIRVNEMRNATGASHDQAKGTLKEGLAYVRATPSLGHTLLMVFIVGMLCYEFPVTLPLFAKFTFGGDAELYAWMAAAFGSGSFIASLLIANRKEIQQRKLMSASLWLAVSMFLASLAPNVGLALFAIFVIGVASVNFLSLGYTVLQMECRSEMRGRIMSLWSMAVLGSTLIGAPVVGWVSEYGNPRWGLVVGGAASIAAAGLEWFLKKK